MARKQKQKYYFTYKTTNLLNNKYYFGMHTTTNLNDEYLGSGKRIRRSINKYGKENFKLEILEFFNTKEELIEGETLLITQEIIDDPMCMNLQLGGGGGFTIEQQRINGLNSNVTKKYLRETDAEWVEKYSENMSKGQLQAYKNGRVPTPPCIRTGIPHTQETKDRIGNSNSIKQSGEKNSQFGTCWIHNLLIKENKKILKEELQKYLELNWLKGRKIKWT